MSEGLGFEPPWGRRLLGLLGVLGVALGCAGKKGVTPDGHNGSGTASGTVGGRTYDAVADSRWIGAPDDPAHTRVIYVFDKLVSCDAISDTGWDEVVSDSTQSLELKLIGTAAGVYPVAANGRPATDEASVNYTLTSTSGTPAETTASAGSVTADRFDEGRSADGSFDLTLPTGSVSGTFHATYCATGREP
jgi:hypothetical protein